MKKFIVSLAVLLALNTHGQTRIKTMFYNVLQFSDSENNRGKTPELKIVLDEVQPDLLMVCEFRKSLHAYAQVSWFHINQSTASVQRGGETPHRTSLLLNRLMNA